MAWWIWVAIGVVMLVLEMAISTDFYMLFTGVAAIIVGLLVYGLSFFDIVLSFSSTSYIFLALSVFLLFYLRKKALRALYKASIEPNFDLVGEEVLILSEIPVGTIGEGETRGTVWQIRNESDKPLPEKSVQRVTSKDGIVLIVK